MEERKRKLNEKIIFNGKVLKILRKNGTFVFINGKDASRNFLIQFSLKDPWILPKHDSKFLDGGCDLYGWLFFYFGRFVNLDQSGPK